jgi:GDP-D-mannose dehydratase
MNASGFCYERCIYGYPFFSAQFLKQADAFACLKVAKYGNYLRGQYIHACEARATNAFLYGHENKHRAYQF